MKKSRPKIYCLAKHRIKTHIKVRKQNREREDARAKIVTKTPMQLALEKMQQKVFKTRDVSSDEEEEKTKEEIEIEKLVIFL